MYVYICLTYVSIIVGHLFDLHPTNIVCKPITGLASSKNVRSITFYRLQ